MEKMRKLFVKEPVWFAVVWIIVYVLLFGNADSLSETMGVPKLLTAVVGAVLSAVLYAFIKRNKLQTYVGLCPAEKKMGSFLRFLPLIIISSVNLWNGVAFQKPPLETLLFIISMGFVAFLEEVIFRGLFFKGMCRENEVLAVVVSSLTFGVGHAVNLLFGAPLFETLLQLVYASAIGFCYTALFFTEGSLFPCIVSHAAVNCLSVFAIEPSPQKQLVFALVQTGLGIGWGLWLLRKKGWLRAKKQV